MKSREELKKDKLYNVFISLLIIIIIILIAGTASLGTLILIVLYDNFNFELLFITYCISAWIGAFLFSLLMGFKNNAED